MKNVYIIKEEYQFNYGETVYIKGVFTSNKRAETRKTELEARNRKNGLRNYYYSIVIAPLNNDTDVKFTEWEE